VVHLVDATSPDPAGQIDAVHEVLAEIGAEQVPEVLAFNKLDQTAEAKALAAAHPGSVAISAHTGEGVDELVATIADRLRAGAHVARLRIPFDRGDVLAAVHRHWEVLEEEAGEDGIDVTARLDEEGQSRFAAFLVEDDAGR
jgi:GTP-binding protein HflX